MAELDLRQARCALLGQLRQMRERQACHEQAMIDSLQPQRAAAFSCRRLSWSEVPSPRVPSPRCFIQECPTCHKQMLLHSLQYHLSRCKGREASPEHRDKTSPRREGAKAATPSEKSLASPAQTPSVTPSATPSPPSPAMEAVTTPRPSPRPAKTSPCTKRCSHCGCPVLRTSVAQHEASCKRRAAAAAEGYPKRRVSTEKVSTGHHPSPTEPCPSCGRLIASHGLQNHYQRCKKWTDILEEKTRPTLLQSGGQKNMKKHEETVSQSLPTGETNESPLKSDTCFVPVSPRLRFSDKSRS